MTLEYYSYLDKVYGCFLGKCVGGNAGGPAEGRKEIMDYPLKEETLNTIAPNDDLDLQLLWIDVIEEKGVNLTSKDLGQAFFDCVPYGPGEYAVFLKNFGRKIMPPVSGKFNNRYYKNGMGCPIRSEIWACIFPCEKERAKKFVFLDGTLDHETDSVLAEYYLVGIESDAFFCDDLEKLILNNLSLLPRNSKVYNVIYNTYKWYKYGYDWKYTRGLILKNYGHPDCTNMYQNMGMIILALLYGNYDLKETVRLGVSCGYDTDCICATAISVLGIIFGANKLQNEFGIKDTGIKAEVLLKRSYQSVFDVAQSIANIALNFNASNSELTFLNKPQFREIPNKIEIPEVEFEINYHGIPVIKYKGSKNISLFVKCNFTHKETGKVKIETPDGITCSYSDTISLPPGEMVEIKLKFKCPKKTKILWQCNYCKLILTVKSREFVYEFGLNGADVWKMYGPFIENSQDISQNTPYEKYGGWLNVSEVENHEDALRNFHLNSYADINKEYLSEPGFFNTNEQPDIPQKESVTVNITEDFFDLKNLNKSQGPNVSYLYRKIYSPEQRIVDIAVGATDPFKLWVNEKFVGMGNEKTWWTVENKHFHGICLDKGVNTLIFKLAQLSGHAEFSITYRIPGSQWKQYYDFASIIDDNI